MFSMPSFGNFWQILYPPVLKELEDIKRCADLSYAEIEDFNSKANFSLAKRIADYHSRFEQGKSITPEEGENLLSELGTHLPTLQKSLKGIIGAAKAESELVGWKQKKAELGQVSYESYLDALAPFIRLMPEPLYARELILPLLSQYTGGIRPGVKVTYPADGVAKGILWGIKNEVSDEQFMLDLNRTTYWTLNKQEIYRNTDYDYEKLKNKISPLVNENGWERIQKFANQMMARDLLLKVMEDPKAAFLPITQCTRDITIDIQDKGSELKFTYTMAQRFTAFQYHPKSFAGSFLASTTLFFPKEELNKPLEEDMDPKKIRAKLTAHPLRFVVN